MTMQTNSATVPLRKKRCAKGLNVSFHTSLTTQNPPRNPHKNPIKRSRSDLSSCSRTTSKRARPPRLSYVDVIFQPPHFPMWMTNKMLECIVNRMVYDKIPCHRFHQTLNMLLNTRWNSVMTENVRSMLCLSHAEANARRTIVYRVREGEATVIHVPNAKLRIVLGTLLKSWPFCVHESEEIPLNILTTFIQHNVDLSAVFPNVDAFRGTDRGKVLMEKNLWCSNSICPGMYIEAEMCVVEYIKLAHRERMRKLSLSDKDSDAVAETSNTVEVSIDMSNVQETVDAICASVGISVTEVSKLPYGTKECDRMGIYHTEKNEYAVTSSAMCVLLKQQIEAEIKESESNTFAPAAVTIYTTMHHELDALERALWRGCTSEIHLSNILLLSEKRRLLKLLQRSPTQVLFFINAVKSAPAAAELAPLPTQFDVINTQYHNCIDIVDDQTIDPETRTDIMETEIMRPYEDECGKAMSVRSVRGLDSNESDMKFVMSDVVHSKPESSYQWNWIRTVRESQDIDAEDARSLMEFEREGSIASVVSKHASEDEWKEPNFPEDVQFGEDEWDQEEMRNPDVVYNKYGSCKSASICFLQAIEERRNCTSVLEDMPKHVVLKTESDVHVPVSFVHPLAVSMSLFCTIKETVCALSRSGIRIVFCRVCGYDPSHSEATRCAAAMYDLSRTCLADAAEGEAIFANSRRCVACAAVRMCVTAVACLIRCPTRNVSKFDFVLDKEKDFATRLRRRVFDFEYCRSIAIGEMFMRGMCLFRNIHYVIGMQTREGLVRTRDVHIEFADVYYGEDAHSMGYQLSPAWMEKIGKHADGWCVVRLASERRLDVLSTIHTMNNTILKGMARCIETYLFPSSSDYDHTIMAMDVRILHLIQDGVLPVMMTYSVHQPNMLTPCPVYPLLLRNYYMGDNNLVFFCFNWLRRMLYTTKSNDMDISKKSQTRKRRGATLPVHLAHHYRLLHILLDSFTFGELITGFIEPFTNPVIFTGKNTNYRRIRNSLAHLKSISVSNPDVLEDPKYRRLVRALELTLLKVDSTKRKDEKKPLKKSGVDETNEHGLLDFAHFHMYSCLKAFVMPYRSTMGITREAVDIIEFIFAHDASLRRDHRVALSILIEMRSKPPCSHVREVCHVWALFVLVGNYAKYSGWHSIEKISYFTPAKTLTAHSAVLIEPPPHEAKWYAWRVLRELRVYDALLYHNDGDVALTKKMFNQRAWNRDLYYKSKTPVETQSKNNSDDDSWWEDVHPMFEDEDAVPDRSFSNTYLFPQQPSGECSWCHCEHCVKLCSTTHDEDLYEIGFTEFASAKHGTYEYTKHIRNTINIVDSETFIIPPQTRMFPDYELPSHFAFYRLICDERVPRQMRRDVFMGISTACKRMKKTYCPSKNWQVDSIVLLKHAADLSRSTITRHTFAERIPDHVPVYVWGMEGFENMYDTTLCSDEFIRRETHLCMQYVRLKEGDVRDVARCTEYLKQYDDLFDVYMKDVATGASSWEHSNETVETAKEKSSSFLPLAEPIVISDHSDIIPDSTALKKTIMVEKDGKRYITIDPLTAQKMSEVYEERMKLREELTKAAVEKKQKQFRASMLPEPETCYARYRVDADSDKDAACRPFSDEEMLDDKKSRCSTMEYVFLILESMSFFSHKIPQRDELNRIKRPVHGLHELGKTTRAHFTMDMAYKTHAVPNGVALAASNIPIPLAFGRASLMDSPDNLSAEERLAASTFTYTNRSLFPLWPSRIIDPVMASYTESILCVGTTVSRPFSCASRSTLTSAISEPVQTIDVAAVKWYHRVVRKSKYGVMYGETKTKAGGRRKKNGTFASNAQEFSDDENEQNLQDQWYGAMGSVPKAWRPNDTNFGSFAKRQHKNLM